MKNRRTIRIWQAWIILGLSIMTVDSVAQCPDKQEIKKYEPQRAFFTHSGAGVTAIMPHVKSQEVASSEHTYQALRYSGTYKLNKELSEMNDFWFVTNHRIGDRPHSEQSSHTYIGVMIAKVLDATRLKHPLHLTRNANWFDLENGTPLKSPVQQHIPPKLAQKFISIQNNNTESQSFKEKFGDWHALANKEPRVSSWDLRREWSDYDLSCLREISKKDNLNPSQILVEARLMKFQATNTYSPNNPVVWRVQLGGAKAVYIKTFSPLSSDFVKEYYISFDR